MGCCSSKNGLKKYPNLYKASLMTRTAKNEVICSDVFKKITTRNQLKKIIDNPNTPEDYRLILTEPYSSVDKITESIYLTGLGGLTKENILELKISCLINATYEAPNYLIEGIETIRVPLDDSSDNDMTPYLMEVADKLMEVTKSKGRAIVHCIAGVSRSTTLVLAHLVKYNNMTLRQAFIWVKQKRELSQPNLGFWKQLIVFEKIVLGTNSVTMIESEEPGLTLPDIYKTDFPKVYVSLILGSKQAREEKQSRQSQRSKIVQTLTQKSKPESDQQTVSSRHTIRQSK